MMHPLNPLNLLHPRHLPHLRTQRVGTSAFLLTLALASVLSSCRTAPGPAPEPAPRPAYDRPLPEGAPALRRLDDPSRWPDFATAWRLRDPLLMEALDASARWFEAPSSRTHFPLAGVTHDRARASVLAFRTLISDAPDESQFLAELRRRFEVYESVGWDGSGTVLFTGYYAPQFPASPVRTERFRAPLYRRPADLVTDPRDGTPLGRRTPDGSVVPYWTRAEIESRGMLRGTELVWVETPLDAFIIHVNGSAKLLMPDGRIMYVGYDGKTDRPYGSLGRAMMDAGLLRPGETSLPRMRQVYRQRPQDVERLFAVNESFVFFREYPEGNWPAGSLGVRVTPDATLATDKRIYPRGGVVLVDTKAITFTRGARTYLRFMLDQDTGGAIRAPGRADIFMGIGETVGILAGEQYAEGRLYYLFLRE